MKKISKKEDFTLEINKLTKKYDNILAVNDVSFNTHVGEIVALLGPNGAGKSTLMNMIAGFVAPTKGSIKIKGKDIAENDILTRKYIGFLSEGAPLYSDMTVKLFLEYMIELKLNIIEQERQKLKEIYKNELNWSIIIWFFDSN